MNKNDFINRLLVKFMTNAETAQAKIVSEDLDSYLPTTIDFDYLYDKVILDYPQKTMPAISWLKQHFRIAKEFEDKSTQWTWDIIAHTKTGQEYRFACYLSVSETEGRETFKKCHPELIYVGNNRRKVMANVY